VSALDRPIGGRHYSDCSIQPVEFIHANRLGFIEGAVIKYVTRHGRKNGAEDIKKAIHFLELLLELEYPDAAIACPAATPARSVEPMDTGRPAVWDNADRE